MYEFEIAKGSTSVRWVSAHQLSTEELVCEISLQSVIVITWLSPPETAGTVLEPTVN